jgi:hypothetical protein
MKEHSRRREHGWKERKNPDEGQAPNDLLKEVGGRPAMLPEQALRFEESDEGGRDGENDGKPPMKASEG